MGSPFMSMSLSGMMGAPPSRGLPMPSKTRPSMSRDTASCWLWPKKRALAVAIWMPWERSKS